MNWSRAVVLTTVLTAACGRLGFEDESPDIDAPRGTELSFGERDGAVQGVVFDTTLKDYEPTNNYAGAGFLGSGEVLPGLVRIDVTSLAGDLVISASLEVSTHISLNPTLTGETVSAAELLEEWLDTEATYVLRMGSLEWAAPGANGAARGETVSNALADGADDRAVLTLPPGLVQRWIDSPEKNHGLLLKTPSGTWLASSEYADPARRPLLRVNVE